MKQEFVYKYIAGLMAVNIIAASLASCSAASSASSASSASAAEAASNTTAAVSTLDKTDDTEATVTTLNTADGGKLSADELFTERDLTQTADLSEATDYTVSDGKTITITKAGVYHISGTASDAAIVVEASSDDKVQIVLDGVSITNADFPCLYVKQADKVFVTLVGENTLSVTGSFTTDGDTNTDGVIFSKDDLVLNGTGSLTVNSNDNGIVCKDDLKVTGGSYTVTASSKALEANDSIRIADGTLYLVAGTAPSPSKQAPTVCTRKMTTTIPSAMSISAAAALQFRQATTASTPIRWCRLTAAASRSPRRNASKAPISRSTAAPLRFRAGTTPLTRRRSRAPTPPPLWKSTAATSPSP